MSWLNIDSIVCLVILILAAIIVYQQYSHQKTVSRLVDRILAKNYGEIIQGEVVLKETDSKKGLDVKVAEEKGVDDIETLNQIL